MSIEIPHLFRTPVRCIYMFCGGAALVGLGFPWCIVSWCLLPWPILSGFVWGLGLPGNCASLLYLLHGSGALVGSLAPWEFGLLGWSCGMGFLLVCAWLEQATRSDGVEGRFCAMLLKPFGVELRVKSVGLGTFIWVIPLVATLFSLAAYFVASWISNPQTALECSDVRLPPGSAAELCFALQGNMKAILDHQNHCCYVEDHTFDLVEFLSSVGGNVVAGYGMVKIFGSVGVAAATDVELDFGALEDIPADSWRRQHCQEQALSCTLAYFGAPETLPAETADHVDKSLSLDEIWTRLDSPFSERSSPARKFDEVRRSPARKFGSLAKFSGTEEVV